MTNVLFTPANLYKDIHKGIRGELFAVTQQLGSFDVSDDFARTAVTERVERLEAILRSHAEHEDAFVQPHIETYAPMAAERIAADHPAFEADFADIVKATRAAETRAEVHDIYLELAAFVGVYLTHCDLEETHVLLPLIEAMGPDAVAEVHHALVASIPPAEMGMVLPIMLTAMNVDDRADLLGGLRATAPAELFTGVWALTGSVLSPGDFAAVGARLGLD